MSDNAIRFLIVDDVEENLMALEALLRRDGLEIHQAQSAAAALELLLLNDYALVLLDVHMPETDGYELAELMRGTERSRRVPIIFVTAAEKDETRRFRGYEAGAVDFIFKPIDPVILKSKAEVFFRIGQQARDLAEQRDEMRAIAQHRDQAMARLRAHTDNSPIGFVELDNSMTIRGWSKGAERIFGHPSRDMLGRAPAESGWITEEVSAKLKQWMDGTFADEAAPQLSLEMQTTAADGREIACELFGSVLTEADGHHRSLTLQVLDITERRKSEEVRSILLGELNHRIKNTLANVQAIARQTIREASSLEAFEKSFSGRLQALARAHSILSNATWSSAPLDELIEDQIRAGTLVPDRLRRSGPRVEISPENMLRMALTLHELGTNAQKYGALSVAGGEVHLVWHMEGESLVLTWREFGGPLVKPPARTGFGLKLISSSAGGGDDGTVKVDWHPEGVSWTIRLLNGVARLPDAAQAAQPVQAPTIPMHSNILAGRRVLLVEDEPIVVLDLTHELEEAGMDIVAIARALPEAMEAARRDGIDLAILDGNLRGEKVDPVAHLLAERGIPFCFLSGYGPEHLPSAFPDAPMIQKPFSSKGLRAALRRLVNGEHPLPA